MQPSIWRLRLQSREQGGHQARGTGTNPADEYILGSCHVAVGDLRFMPD